MMDEYFILNVVKEKEAKMRKIQSENYTVSGVERDIMINELT